MLLTVLKPILLLSVISTSVSLLFSNNILSFSKIFIATSLAQILLYNLYVSIMQLFAEKIKNERMKEYSKQGMEITCPCYLEKKMLIPIDLNGDNTFKCFECQKNVSVNVTAKAFMQTEMVDLDKADSAFLEAYNKIQEK